MLLLTHRYGRFDRRSPVAPATWPHHDLLWLHEGAVRLLAGADALDLHAPDGVLIGPGVPFRGHVIGSSARASVCHFAWDDADGPAPAGALPRCEAASRADVQSAARFALRLAQSVPDATARRSRLLRAILDAFLPADAPSAPPPDPLVAAAWLWVADNLSQVQTLADAAAYAGLSVSRFPARHRAARGGSAGGHLRSLRLAAAEHLLNTTGLGVGAIARAIGYAHLETFSAAFSARNSASPNRYRRAFSKFAWRLPAHDPKRAGGSAQRAQGGAAVPRRAAVARRGATSGTLASGVGGLEA